MAPPHQAESKAKERLARATEDVEEHDRESERRTALRAELVARREAARAVVEREEALAQEAFPVLPPELVRVFFSLLPVDQRMLCREVCPQWRAFLEERRLWWVVDLSRKSGVRKLSASLLRAASRRAGGQLRVLDISGWKYQHTLSFAALRAVAEENAATLTELRA